MPLEANNSFQDHILVILHSITWGREAFQRCWKYLANLHDWPFQEKLNCTLKICIFKVNKSQATPVLQIPPIPTPACRLVSPDSVDTYYSFVSVSCFVWYRMMSWVWRVSLRWRCMVLIIRVVWWLLHAWIRWLQESYIKCVECSKTKVCTQGLVLGIKSRGYFHSGGNNLTQASKSDHSLLTV